MNPSQNGNLSTLVTYPAGTPPTNVTAVLQPPMTQMVSPNTAILTQPTVPPVGSTVNVITSPATPIVTDSSAVNNFTATLYNQLCQKGLWLFVLAAIVVIIVVAWISRAARPFWATLDKWAWGNNELIWFVILVIGLLLFAWSCYGAYSALIFDTMRRNLILAGFIIALILVIVWFFMFFRTDKDGVFVTDGIRSSTYVAAILAIVLILMLWPMWQCSWGIKIGIVVLLIWAIAMALLSNNIAGNIEPLE